MDNMQTGSKNATRWKCNVCSTSFSLLCSYLLTCPLLDSLRCRSPTKITPEIARYNTPGKGTSSQLFHGCESSPLKSRQLWLGESWIPVSNSMKTRGKLMNRYLHLGPVSKGTRKGTWQCESRRQRVLSLIIAAETPCAFCKIPDFHFPIPLKILEPCPARSSNLRKANIHHSIHIIKTSRLTRTGFCGILIFSDHIFWNDTTLKSDWTDRFFWSSIKIAILSYLNHDELLYPKQCGV
jgi:hypothetical protein